MACSQLTAYKGRGAVHMAVKNSDGTNGVWFPVAEGRRLEITSSQTFQDEYSRCDRSGGNIIHALESTDMEIALETFDFKTDVLNAAFYAATTTKAAGTATGETVKFTKVGETVPLKNPFGVSITTITSNSATALIADTDYELDEVHGTITLLSSTKFTGGAPFTLTTTYQYGSYAEVQSNMNSIKEYTIRFDGINVLDSKPYQVYIHRVSMNLSTNLSLINEGTAALEMTGKLLPDYSKGASESAYWVAKIGNAVV